MFIGYIYKIINLVNNKIYIGQTRKTLLERFKQHILRSKKPNKFRSHLYEAMRFYGVENFKIELVEEVRTNLTDLYKRERYWIKLLNTTNNTIGYNIDLGGRGGDITHLLPEAQQLEIKEKLRQANLGKKQSIETIAKRVSKNIGRIAIHKDNKNKYIQKIDLDYYLALGWVIGRTENANINSHTWSADLEKRTITNKKIAEKARGRFKGYIRVVNQFGDKKLVPADQETYYINLGYQRGQKFKVDKGEN